MLVFLPVFAFAQTGETVENPSVEVTSTPIFASCDKNFSLTGPRQVRVNTSHEY